MLQEQTIAFDMLKDSKFCITGLVRAAAEASHPQLRQFINQSLADVVQEHFMLSDTMVSKGWYQPMDITAQLQADMAMANQLNGTVATGNQSTTTLQ